MVACNIFYQNTPGLSHAASSPRQPAITLGESLLFSMASSSMRVVEAVCLHNVWSCAYEHCKHAAAAATLKLNLLRKCSTKAKHAPQLQEVFFASDWSIMCKTNRNPWQEIYFCLRQISRCKFI